MGVRKTIYVPSTDIWDGIKENAKKAGQSVSEYLVRGCNLKPSPQMDRIESKLDKLIGGQFHRAIPMAPDGLSEGFKDRLEDDMEMLAKKQAEINSIKAKKIAKVKDNIRPDSELKDDIVNQLGQARRSYPKKSWAKK